VIRGPKLGFLLRGGDWGGFVIKLVGKESDASGSTAHLDLAMRDLQASMGGVERLSELGLVRVEADGHAARSNAAALPCGSGQVVFFLARIGVDFFNRRGLQYMAQIRSASVLSTCVRFTSTFLFRLTNKFHL
jgi:hypothetical protein